MSQFKQPPHKPTKEVVRVYMQGRIGSNEPPPTSDEINRQLGRHLAEQARDDKSRK